MDETLNVAISDMDCSASGHVLRFTARITHKDDPVCVLRIDRSHPHRDKRRANPLQLRTLTFETWLPGCPVLDSSNVRVPIRRYVAEAIEAAGRNASEAAGRDVSEVPPTPWDGKRGKKTTDEQLGAVVGIYRRAVDEHKYPLREIERALNVAHPTAARYVMQARERGLLGPAPAPGFSGEAGE
jgi:hypothetical protein